MKVKEYLVGEILNLKTELRIQKKAYEELSRQIREYLDKIKAYEMEKEHIKQSIICNIEQDELGCDFISLYDSQADFKTLLAILDIQPGDYKEDNNAEAKD